MMLYSLANRVTHMLLIPSGAVAVAAVTASSQANTQDYSSRWAWVVSGAKFGKLWRTQRSYCSGWCCGSCARLCWWFWSWVSASFAFHRLLNALSLSSGRVDCLLLSSCTWRTIGNASIGCSTHAKFVINTLFYFLKPFDRHIQTIQLLPTPPMKRWTSD